MNHVGTITCSSCGKHAPAGALYCACCGAGLRGAARHLGAVPAVMSGAFVAVSALLVRSVVEHALETMGTWIPYVRLYGDVVSYLMAVASYLSAGVGGALCARFLRSRRLLSRAGASAAVGAIHAAVMASVGLLGLDLISVAAAGAVVAFAALGGVVWSPAIARLARVAPFSWATRVTTDNRSTWCFAVVVLGMETLFLATPWLVVWIIAGSLALHLARAVAGIDVAPRSGPAAEQVAS